MRPEPVTLVGTSARLEPLTVEHVPALASVGVDPELWRWTLAVVHDEEEMRQYVQNALDEQAAGRSLPFAIVDRASNRVVGSSRYGNIDRDHRRVEIGWSWIARPWQRSAINTEAKLLLLRHAFETLGCIRVEFKTDALNEKSRAALGRIGALEEGIFRQHMITASGRLRDTVYFSVIDRDWPSVRSGLLRRLDRRTPPSPKATA